MLNFNQSDPSNFSCQVDPNISTESTCNNNMAGQPTAFSSDLSSYPLMSGFGGSGRGRNNSPAINTERYFESDPNQTTESSLFPFVVPSKGSENVKRFSVNNLLQLAQCTSASNLLSSARSMGR